MEILKLRFTYRETFLTAWDRTLPHGGLFVHTTRPLAPGVAVVVELGGRLFPGHLMLRGTVVSARLSAPRQRVSAGLRVAFLAEERPAFEFLDAVARGERPARRRQALRLPLSLPVRYRRAGQVESYDAEVLDLSTVGLGLRAAEALPVDTRLVVQLPVPGGLRPLEVQGAVVSAAPGGGRVGLKFDRRQGCTVLHLKEAIRRLRAA